MTNTKQATDEREAFEKWYCQDAERQGVPFPGGIEHLREGDGYGTERTMLIGKWEGWKAHAAISTAPATPNEDGTEKASVTRAELVREVTKAILFEDCGNTQDWEDNLKLGAAAVVTYEAQMNTSK